MYSWNNVKFQLGSGAGSCGMPWVDLMFQLVSKILMQCRNFDTVDRVDFGLSDLSNHKKIVCSGQCTKNFIFFHLKSITNKFDALTFLSVC